MKNKFKNTLIILLIILSFLLTACQKDQAVSQIEKDGSYTSLEEVSAYLKEYGELPSNYVTKRQARDMGWIASKGNLWEVTDKKSIGGDVFHNREGSLPEKEGRTYYEADIDYKGGPRGPERIVYSNDGLLYYTKDHYKNFEKIE